LNKALTAINGIDHTLDIQDFSLKPDPGSLERIFLFLQGLLSLLIELGLDGVWTSQNGLSLVATCQVLKSLLLELSEVLEELLLVLLA